MVNKKILVVKFLIVFVFICYLIGFFGAWKEIFELIMVSAIMIPVGFSVAITRIHFLKIR